MYSGEEEREIGLFKFRVGMFKFVLPTFSKESSWLTGDGGRLRSVPLPRNERRKSGLGARLKGKRNTEKREDLIEGVENIDVDKHQSTKENPSVAFVIVDVSSPSTLVTSQYADRATTCREKAKQVATYVKKAHATSSHRYQLYLPILRASTDGEETTKCHEVLKEFGFSLLELTASTGVDVKQESMKSMAILNKHSIIHHIPTTNFTVLNTTDVNDETTSQSKEESEGKKLRVRPGDVFKFKANSKATISYLGLLKCHLTSKRGATTKQSALLETGRNMKGDTAITTERKRTVHENDHCSMVINL